MTTIRPLSKQVFQKTRALVPKNYRPVSTQTSNSTVAAAASSKEAIKIKSKRLVFDSRSPSLQDFLAQRQVPLKPVNNVHPDNVPYLQAQTQLLGKGKKFYIEVYGCQVQKSTFI